MSFPSPPLPVPGAAAVVPAHMMPLFANSGLSGTGPDMSRHDLPAETATDIPEQVLIVHPQHNFARFLVDRQPPILTARFFRNFHFAHSALAAKATPSCSKSGNLGKGAIRLWAGMDCGGAYDGVHQP